MSTTMAPQTAPAGDFPPPYYASPAHSTDDLPNYQPGITPLTRLSATCPDPQLIECTFCHQQTHARIAVHGPGQRLVTGAMVCFQVCFFFVGPLSYAPRWAEETKWYCDGCGEKVASRRPGFKVEVRKEGEKYLGRKGERF